MVMSDFTQLVKLWKWAFDKWYRIPVAAFATIMVTATIYLTLFVETNDRLQVLENWCSDMAYWIGIPISWMTAYWHVFLAVVLAIITAIIIITYILYQFNGYFVKEENKLKMERDRLVRAKGKVSDARVYLEHFNEIKNPDSGLFRLSKKQKDVLADVKEKLDEFDEIMKEQQQ